MADPAKLPWDMRAGIALWLVLFALVLADVFANFSGAKADTKLGILLLLVLLPSAASIKGFGVEFVRRTNDESEAFKENNAKIEARISKLEECCDESKPKEPAPRGKGFVAKSVGIEPMKGLGMRKAVPARLTPEQARAKVTAMLSDRAYNMRSATAIANETGWQERELAELMAKTEGVVPVARSDGEIFYGYRERVRTYFESRGQTLPGK